MTAPTIFEAISDVARVYTNVYGADNIDLPNTPFTPPLDAPWARLRLEHTAMGQGSLADASGRKIWNRAGSCTIELRSPLGEGLEGIYALAEAVVLLYQNASTPSDVWFKSVRLIDDESVIKQAQWYQINVVFDFEYHQIS